jgi:translation initiation factor IF-2
MNNQDSKNNQEKGNRSTLTLKIRSDNNSVNSSSSSEKRTEVKSNEKFNSSNRNRGVQVTIKGRKSGSDTTKKGNNFNNTDPGSLNVDEIKARYLAVSGVNSSNSSKIDNSDAVLRLKNSIRKKEEPNQPTNKIEESSESNLKHSEDSESDRNLIAESSSDESRDTSQEELSLGEPAEEVSGSNQELENSKASEVNNHQEESSNLLPAKEPKEDLTEKSQIKHAVTSFTANNKSNPFDKITAGRNLENNTNIPVVSDEKKKKTPFKVDPFDVRSKIRQSIETSNKEKLEKEKSLQEKKNAEEKQKQEQVQRSNVEKELKKPKTRAENIIADEEEKRKNKFSNKTEKVNTRKLTYFIDNDDEDGSFRKKKRKSRHEANNNDKEYRRISREVILPELIQVADLADRMSEKVGDVVKKLFSMGMVATSNQVIDADTAELILGEFGHSFKRVQSSDVENVLEEDNGEFELLPRAPVVTIMGHVDHGKTSLLDALRSTDVASRESGGITQHIGASRIQLESGQFITFLDTPGHEAFTEMRSRGANVTDIVVLVVAADDGVKEQTVEAINHAKAANVPIIIAVNKIDRPGADSTRVKNELLAYNVVAEDLGGDSIFIEVSAKKRINLDKLEEAILLQAEVLELKSRHHGKANGVVIESRIDSNNGVVASMLVQNGVLNVGDLIVVGTAYGKIRRMLDDKGKSIKIATPSVPVEIMGLDMAPKAGDKFVEVEEEKQAREIISYRSRKLKDEKAMKNSARTTAEIFKTSGAGSLKYLNIIIKGDVNGSVEAIQGSILKLSSEEVAIKIIHAATGGITQSDIALAAVSGAVVIGFNVRSNNEAKTLAEDKNIDVRYYSIIYNLVDELKLLLSGMLSPIHSENYLGSAQIRQVFKISGLGKIAGGFVLDGIIKRNAKVRLLRDNIVIFEGILKTLKRFKEDAKEVKTGFECGFSLENYDDIKELDVVECFETVEQKR